MRARKKNGIRSLRLAIVSIRCGLVLLVIAPVMGCRTVRQQPQHATPSSGSQVRANANSVDPEQNWGIRVEGLRLSAHGHMIDFRYRVLDSDKAFPLADPANNAYLIDEATGTRLKVPVMPKVGALRSTATALKAGVIYTILFANPGLLVKTNDCVTLEVGACRIEHLRMQ